MKVTISKNTDTSLQEAQDIIQNTIRKLTNAYTVYIHKVLYIYTVYSIYKSHMHGLKCLCTVIRQHYICLQFLI